MDRWDGIKSAWNAYAAGETTSYHATQVIEGNIDVVIAEMRDLEATVQLQDEEIKKLRKALAQYTRATSETTWMTNDREDLGRVARHALGYGDHLICPWPDDECICGLNDQIREDFEGADDAVEP
jgi:predicted Zn-dependent peptidase